MSLSEIETYYDTVPRASATTEQIGPFTLFVAAPDTGWDFYARPRLGVPEQIRSDEITPDDVRRVLARQRELGVAQAVEWVDEVTPSLLPAVRAAVPQVEIQECPLLVLPAERAVKASAPGRYEVLAAHSPDLGSVVGAQGAAFEGIDTFEAKGVGRRPEQIEQGNLIVVGAYAERGEIVGGGTAAPRGGVSELMGIGVIPSARRTGHGVGITVALVEAARAAGAELVFLSAASDDAASIYRAVGFERIGAACIVEGLDD